MSELERIADAVALIPAAGGGVRLGQGPKAFLQIAGRSLLQHVVEMVRQRIERILVAVPEDQVALAQEQLAGLAEVHPGGATRLGTVTGLYARTTESLVIIHDAARPFASLDVFSQVIEAGRVHGAATASRAIRVPVARVEDGFVKECIPHSRAGTFETPQAYQRAVLERAFQAARKSGSSDVAVSDLVAGLGIPFRMITDTDANFKITTPLDWEIATKVIAPTMSPKP